MSNTSVTNSSAQVMTAEELADAARRALNERDYDQAESILAHGLSRFPEDERLAAEHGWLAHQQGNWFEADRRWTALRQRWPQSFTGYYGGGAARRMLCRFDDADTLYREALELWPKAANLLGDFAAVAQSRGDYAEASRRWAALRAFHPELPEGYLRHISALRSEGHYPEAEALINEGMEHFPDDSALMVQWAEVAHQLGQPAEALKRWDAVATRFPGGLEFYVGAARALNDLGRFADAENVLRPALRMFPNDPDIASLSAWTAHYRKAYPDALQQWASFRERFPGHVVGYTGAVTSLLASSRASEAGNLAEEAMRLFPQDVYVGMAYARSAEHLGDWNQAATRWSEIHDRHPDAPAVKVGYGQALAKAGHWDEAAQVLEAAAREHSGDIAVLKAEAEFSTQRREWTEAEARWRAIAARFPERATGWSGLAAMLRAAGRLQEADQIVTEGLAQFPHEVELARERAMTASLRRDWRVALPLWDELKRSHPNGPGIADGVKQALWQAQQDLGVAAAEGAPFEIPSGLLNEIEPIDGSVSPELTKLFMRFESLGDTCEFGIVQRRFGAEPIGLLRWASLNPAHLIRALEERFAGVGDPEHTIIAVSHGEYTTRDKRYHMFSHTFTPEAAEPIERFTAQHLRRMQFVQRKLVSDLEQGEKVFVYKSNQGLSVDVARSMFSAIRAYGGKPAFLCVCLADDQHESGTVSLLQDGLFMGYIDRFSTVDINIDAWVAICREVGAACAPIRS